MVASGEQDKYFFTAGEDEAKGHSGKKIFLYSHEIRNYVLFIKNSSRKIPNM